MVTPRVNAGSARPSSFPFITIGKFLQSTAGLAAVASTQSGSRQGGGRRGRRRPRSRPEMAGEEGAALQFSLATYNLRGVMDRWAERKPLLQQTLRDMDADVLCFQEVLTGEYGQDRELLGPAYHVFPCKAALFNLLADGGNPLLAACARAASSALAMPPLAAAMAAWPAAVEAWRERHHLHNGFFRTLRDITLLPFFGNSLACRLADAHEIKHSTLVLGDWRAAQRIEFEIGEGERRTLVYVVNAHLDHEHPDKRQRQAVEVCDWMEAEKKECAAILFCGDFNGPPNEPFHSKLAQRGYRSAHAACHGREPDYTWPTGIQLHRAFLSNWQYLQAPLMDHGPAECLDFIYIWADKRYDVQVLDARVYGAAPAEHDKTLFPSDHAAVKATLQIRCKMPEALARPQQQQHASSL